MNKISKMVQSQNDINYDILKKIEEHAKEYKTAVDKKEFLKSIGAYEQKLILLNSINPYEVLCYMEQLDLPTTKLILSQLNYEEITKILDLFTTEDRKKFYTTFSELSLVNQFIVYDKKADEYIEDLSIDRKINLLNASDSETVLASSKVYDSISEKDKERVASSISSSDALSALSGASSYIDSNVASDVSNNVSTTETNVQEEDVQINNNEKQNEELKEKLETPEEKQEQILEQQEKIEYFVNNFEKYLISNPELKDIDINDPQIYNLLSADLLALIDTDFQNFKNGIQQETNVIENELEPSSTLEQFHDAKVKCEGELIQNLQSQLSVDIIDDVDQTKTL